MADEPIKLLSSVTGRDLLDYGRTVLPLFAVWFGYWLRGFESRTSNLEDRVDEVVDEISGLLTAGSSYWRRDTTANPQDAEDIALEAEIQGRNHVINVLFESMASSFSENHTNFVRITIGDLRQSLTSGDFASAKGHVASGAAISKTYSVASQLRVQLRASLRKRRWNSFLKN